MSADTPIYDSIDKPVETVVIDGHTVDAATEDMFYDMKTGKRITDEEWDETQRRIRDAIGQIPPHLMEVPF